MQPQKSPDSKLKGGLRFIGISELIMGFYFSEVQCSLVEFHHSGAPGQAGLGVAWPQLGSAQLGALPPLRGYRSRDLLYLFDFE